MRRHVSSLALGLGTLSVMLLAGCPSRNITKVVPNTDKEEFKDIPVQLNRDLDILFLVDTSNSMRDEQIALGDAFPEFINVLETIEGGLPNVHIGVISPDLGAGSVCGGTPDNGELQNAPCPNYNERDPDTNEFISTCANADHSAPGCTAPSAAFIRDVSDGAGDRDRNYPADQGLADTFTCIASLGTGGCGFEQQLEAVRRALNGSRPENEGFLRESAFLAVIIVTDEDDCSTQDPTMFDATQTEPDDPLGPVHSFRCFEFGVTCDVGNSDPRAVGPRDQCYPNPDSDYMHNVDEYVDFLKGLKGDDSLVIVANITGPEAPVAVGRDVENPTWPALVPSCTSAGGKAEPAIRLQYFAQQFPNRNAFTSICNENLSDGLQLIAELLKEAIGNPCIEALLKDANPNADGLQYECSVSDVVNPGTDEQEETVLPHCNQPEDIDPTDQPNSTNLPCWHLAEDAENCAETPTQLSLVVERGDVSPPTGTHVQAHCVTCNDVDEDGECDTDME